MSCKACKINRHLLILFIAVLLVFGNCQTNTQLFDDITKMAQLDRVYKPTLIQSGKEDAFENIFLNFITKPMMEYNIFRINSLEFQNLEKAILKNDKFKEGSFYFNIELNDYIYNNDLGIINMSKSFITNNKYQTNYYIYLLSDRKTFAVCKVNL